MRTTENYLPNNIMTSKKIVHIGIAIYAIAFLFAIIETIYFGGNWKPKSEAEIICDKIALLMSAIATIILFYGFIKAVRKEIHDFENLFNSEDDQ